MRILFLAVLFFSTAAIAADKVTIKGTEALLQFKGSRGISVKEILMANAAAKMKPLPGAAKEDGGEGGTNNTKDSPKDYSFKVSRYPLSNNDIKQYKHIFKLQSEGKWGEADAAIEALNNTYLLGYVQKQRYLHPAYRTSFSDARAWLASYKHYAGADVIYSLAESRGDDLAGVKRPDRARTLYPKLDLELTNHGETILKSFYRSNLYSQPILGDVKQVLALIDDGKAGTALVRLDASKGLANLTTADRDRLRALIANTYYYYGNLSKALELAHEAAMRSGDHAALAGWVAGLVSWRQGRYPAAVAYFEMTAKASDADPWMQSAGAYWASRAHMRIGNTEKVSGWLQKAAAHPRTFYGLIATRALGLDFNFAWQMPSLTEDRKGRLAQYDSLRRAMALTEVGQYAYADDELSDFAAGQIGQDLLAFANDNNNLPQLSLRLSGTVTRPDGGLYDAALYPFMPWVGDVKAQKAYDIALVHAFARQESRFNPTVRSKVGATGLMQIMPATAATITGNNIYLSGEGRYKLKSPHYNIKLGSEYIQTLMSLPEVDNNLFYLAIAYNAGPGNLRRFQSQLESITNDPLLFIESIPLSETRTFVERVLSNYWIYQLRLEEPTTTLNAVAEGKAPLYGINQTALLP